MVGTLRHRLIDRLGREYPILALLQQKDRLVDHRDQDPVHDEARRVLADDRGLAHLFGDAHAERHRLLGRLHPWTTSTSRMTGTGFMKCKPSTCAGRPEAGPSFVIEMEDVLLASTVSGRHNKPSCRKRSHLSVAFSGTASMMSGTSSKSRRRLIGRRG